MNAENTAMTPAAENAVAETATESIGTRFMVLLLERFFVQIYKWIPRSNNSIRFPGWRRFAGFFRSLFW